MNETTITLTGNLTEDPSLRYTPSGAVVANFAVASTPRRFDKASNAWRDGDPIFMRCTLWNAAAENLAESLARGARVVVTGRLRSRSWETHEGGKRTALELDVDDIGASLKFATVTVTKATRQVADQAPTEPTEDRPPF